MVRTLQEACSRVGSVTTSVEIRVFAKLFSHVADKAATALKAEGEGFAIAKMDHRLRAL